MGSWQCQGYHTTGGCQTETIPHLCPAVCVSKTSILSLLSLSAASILSPSYQSWSSGVWGPFLIYLKLLASNHGGPETHHTFNLSFPCVLAEVLLLDAASPFLQLDRLQWQIVFSRSLNYRARTYCFLVAKRSFKNDTKFLLAGAHLQ